MEMHTTRALYATHGIVIQRRPRKRWINLALAVWSRMKLALHHQLEIRRAEAEGESVSEHMLKDIGIERNDMQRLVRGNPSVLDRSSEGAPC
jgi:uncharacterized protein YjiS (DUF1127 family)